MRADAYRYVSSCTVCQARKVVTNPRPVPLQPIAPPNEHFDVVGIDHMDPFPRIKHGNKFLIVATDYLTKWVDVHDVPNSGPNNFMSFINECLVYRHRTPKLLISDRGTAFTSRDIEKFFCNHGIRHAGPSPQHPQTDGLVDHTNRTIKNVISSYVSSTHDD
ncbi:hypothetical protein HPB50_006915 [Hyalomma asiaticum]|uniref:Uncharacterized protein n=1 Tax=Hyalomma asiaticum TaxID=266040 RepID=A0ACB7S204_HYAAI|nr:hypothetical protein HPB50_006915 [Hyalomma asiaticum]